MELFSGIIYQILFKNSVTNISLLKYYYYIYLLYIIIIIMHNIIININIRYNSIHPYNYIFLFYY